jgi:hypothetical protein
VLKAKSFEKERLLSLQIFKGGATMDYTEEVLRMIDAVEKEYYKPPKTYKMNKGEFMHRSFKSWAIKELRIYILSHFELSPIEAIEQFRQLMDDFSCRSKDGGISFMFSTAYDVSTDILDNLLPWAAEREHVFKKGEIYGYYS